MLTPTKFVGQVTQHVFPKATQKVFSDWKLSKLGSWSLLIIIWQTFGQAFETHAFDSVKGNNMVFIVFMSIVFYAFMDDYLLLALETLAQQGRYNRCGIRDPSKDACYGCSVV